jgi:hypothetical protein
MVLGKMTGKTAHFHSDNSIMEKIVCVDCGNYTSGSPWFFLQIIMQCSSSTPPQSSPHA